MIKIVTLAASYAASCVCRCLTIFAKLCSRLFL